MIGVYFSGTGNTRFCMEKFLTAYEGKAEMYALEAEETDKRIEESNEIVLGYAVHYSNLPTIVRDFIMSHASIWKDKKIFIIATMGGFSGDGTGVAARLLKKYGAHIIGGLHLKMPDSIGDVKVLKRSLEENHLLVQQAGEKIEKAALTLKEGKPGKEGLGLASHLLGLFGQRLYFYNKNRNYTDQLKIDAAKCIGCGVCMNNCPMHNITIKKNKAEAKGKCTMCYRCISNCPKQAITLLGEKVIEQSKIEKYI